MDAIHKWGPLAQALGSASPAGGPGSAEQNAGYDPYNSMAGMDPNAIPGAMTPGNSNAGMDPYNHGALDPDQEAGSVPTGTNPQHAAIIRAMHNAYSNKGVNPYNSHPEQAKKWERAWKDRTNREAIKAAGGMQQGPAAVAPSSPPMVTNQASAMPRIKR